MARAKAQEFELAVKAGIDPSEQQQEASELTVARLADLYIEKYRRVLANS